MTTRSGMTLPPELWRETLHYLGQPDLIRCSAISRTFHGLTLPLVFGGIHVVLGNSEIPVEIRGVRGMARTQPPTVPDDEEGERSWYILDRIVTDPTFASVVRRLRVSAFSHQPLTFERQYLIKALTYLPHLQEFVWTRSPLHPDVADAILEHQPCLSVLRLAAASEDTLAKFAQLKHLKLFTYSFSHAGEEEDVSPSSSIVSTIIESSESTLRALTLPTNVLWQLPVRLLSGLTELDLFEVEDPTGLSLLFHHLPQLESLAIAGLHNTDIFPILKAYPYISPPSPQDTVPRPITLTPFPRLHSFKLISETTILPSHFIHVCNFIRGRHLLRRLDLDLDSQLALFHPNSGFAPHPLWDALDTMPALRVLGLCGGQWDEFLPSAHRLPTQLTELRLSGFFGLLAGEVNMIPLWDALLRLKGLRTFYIHSPDLSRGPLNAEEIAADHPKLEVIAVDRWVYHVERPSQLEDEASRAADGQMQVNLRQWSQRRVMTHSIDDWGSADAEWLVRYLAYEPR